MYIGAHAQQRECGVVRGRHMKSKIQQSLNDFKVAVDQLHGNVNVTHSRDLHSYMLEKGSRRSMTVKK